MKIMIALLTMILLFTSSLFAAEDRKAIVMKVKGDVSVRIAQEEWKPAATGMVLHQNDEIRTGKQSTAELILDGEGETGELQLKPESRMRMGVLEKNTATGDKTTVLDLAIGQVMVHAQKLQGESKFQVRTPNSTTGVRGTTFLVSAAPKEKK